MLTPHSSIRRRGYQDGASIHNTLKNYASAFPVPEIIETLCHRMVVVEKKKPKSHSTIREYPKARGDVSVGQAVSNHNLQPYSPYLLLP